MAAFYAFYAFSALVKSGSYGNIDGSKVQVPLRHFEDPVISGLQALVCEL